MQLAPRQPITVVPRGKAWTSGVVSIGALTDTIRVRLRRSTPLALLDWAADCSLEIRVEVMAGDQRFVCEGGTTGGIRRIVQKFPAVDVLASEYELSYQLPVGFGAKAQAYLEWAQRDDKGYFRDVPLTRLGETCQSFTAEIRVRHAKGEKGITTELLEAVAEEAPAPSLERHRNSVAFDAQTSATETGGDGVLSLTHTRSAGATAAAVASVAWSNAGAGSGSTSMTYGGASMGSTRFAFNIASNPTDEIASYVLANPSTGAQTVTSTVASFEPQRQILHVTTYTGVDQTTPVVASSPTTSTGTSSPITVTGGGSPSSGSMWVDFIFQQSVGSPSVGANQTSRILTTSGDYRIGTSTQSAADGAVMSWTPSGLDFYGAGTLCLNEAASGISGTIGLVTETDSAQGMTRIKRRALGQLTETDIAQAFSRRKSRVLGQPSETDSVQALARRKSKAIGILTETDSAMAMRAVRRYPIGLVTENDLALAMLRAKRKAVAQVSETDSALSMTRVKTRTIGLVPETDIAQAMSRLKRLTIAQVVENDTALSFGSQLVAQLGLVTETDSAFGMTRRKRRTMGQPSEADTAQPFAARKAKAIALVLENDNALAMQRAKRKLIGLVVEVDSAFAVVHLKRQALGLASETAFALPIINGSAPVYAFVMLSNFVLIPAGLLGVQLRPAGLRNVLLRED